MAPFFCYYVCVTHFVLLLVKYSVCPHIAGLLWLTGLTGMRVCVRDEQKLLFLYNYLIVCVHEREHEKICCSYSPILISMRTILILFH